MKNRLPSAISADGARRCGLRLDANGSCGAGRGVQSWSFPSAPPLSFQGYFPRDRPDPSGGPEVSRPARAEGYHRYPGSEKPTCGGSRLCGISRRAAGTSRTDESQRRAERHTRRERRARKEPRPARRRARTNCCQRGAQRSGVPDRGRPSATPTTSTRTRVARSRVSRPAHGPER